jgi:hypothetical protein
MIRDYGWRGGCPAAGVTDAGVGSGEWLGSGSALGISLVGFVPINCPETISDNISPNKNPRTVEITPTSLAPASAPNSNQPEYHIAPMHPIEIPATANITNTDFAQRARTRLLSKGTKPKIADPTTTTTLRATFMFIT